MRIWGRSWIDQQRATRVPRVLAAMGEYIFRELSRKG